jgi:alpha-ketoglutarate-dependent taurine dioxygenase
MAVLTTEKLSPTVGALVEDLDRDRLLDDPDLPEQIHEALEANGALVFRGLHLDDDTQIAFSRRLGEVEKLGHGDNPEIFRVTLDPSKNHAAQYLKGTFQWHIDGCTDDIPIMATVLSAHAVAATGGETEFASTYGAYEALSDDDKARADAMRVVHTIEASQRLHNPSPTEEEVARWRMRPPKEHPLVWKHENGRRSLVIGATASHVAGEDEAEGKALLQELLEHATAPERVYRHTWEVGDLVIWDNRGVLHRACPYDPTSARDMHRCTLSGNEAIQ